MTQVESRPVREPGGALVLMYHGLHADPDAGAGYDPRYSVHPDAFARQMARLAAMPGARDPVLAPAPAAGGVRAVVSFDDGDASNATAALPVLQSLGLGAICFITTDWIGRPGMLSTAQVRTLSAAGMIIGSHGASHRFLNTLSDAELARELGTSRVELSRLTGQPVDLLSLPGGRWDARVMDAAVNAGYRWVFGSRPHLNPCLQACAGQQAPLGRVVIDRSLDDRAFDGLLAWRGGALRRIRARHALLTLPKRILGDARYDRLRQRMAS